MSAPLYLYTGPEIGSRNEQVESIRKSLEKKFGDIDSYLLYASDSKIEDIVAKLQTDSLFVPATCVVLREAELIKKKDEIEIIAAWLKNAKDTSVLILVSDEISIDSKLDKLVPKENKQIFWAMDESRLGSWLQNHFRKSGYSIELDAIDSILELAENNTEALRSECNRFFLCFPKEHTISVSDVEQILAHNREESAFTLFDAMANPSESPSMRFESALSILQKILLTKNNSPVMILAGLASCFRRLELWHSIHAGGAYLDDFALKSKGFTSKTARNQYSRASRVWNFGQCAAVLAAIASADAEMRSSGTALQDTQLSLLLYEVIMKNGGRSARYEASELLA
ncbi:MAG: DNA polymerase III subunit delta [Treponema sp.]|uniref:DNA polymerase III subunit delta n=1 Tax=Treponema sp. TaxID=166 RepID=UPI0025D4A05C|nr:DNA polymerase III subunit delta [Treponema sp.]MBQ9282568.1 DNA polymerase III subunit delta [Treponema sp.]